MKRPMTYGEVLVDAAERSYVSLEVFPLLVDQVVRAGIDLKAEAPFDWYPRW